MVNKKKVKQVSLIINPNNLPTKIMKQLHNYQTQKKMVNPQRKLIMKMNLLLKNQMLNRLIMPMKQHLKILM